MATSSLSLTTASPSGSRSTRAEQSARLSTAQGSDFYAWFLGADDKPLQGDYSEPRRDSPNAFTLNNGADCYEN
ncbi:MAG: hypothetical protein J2P21_08875 [Chloracidobacterium sp.]|nr:hypothetical protein [Chloracidobacterium sp.]